MAAPDTLGDRFKAAFRTHPSGIALLTATTPAGPFGLTASSVASVGLDPVALSFSVTRATGSAGAILSAESYLVHLIDAEHLEVAREFAVSGGERFTPRQGWRETETGEPHLPGTRAALRCRSLHVLPVGESSVVIAEVLDIVTDPGPHTPVVYHDRTFHRLGTPL